MEHSSSLQSNQPSGAKEEQYSRNEPNHGGRDDTEPLAFDDCQRIVGKMPGGGVAFVDGSLLMSKVKGDIASAAVRACASESISNRSHP